MFWRRRTHADFSDEVQAHLDLETDRLVAEGVRPDDARMAALRAFGRVLTAQERFHDASPWAWLEQLTQDLRYAWRGMRRSPAFVAMTVLTLAVGLGLVTVAFTVFNAYVLRPFAVRDPSSLHRIGWRSQDDGGQSFRWRDYEELRDRRDLFDAVMAESTRFVSSNGRPLAAFLVSGNYFEALGARFALGRPFAGGDAAGAAGAAVVISHQAWTRLFGRDPAVLGRDLDVNGRPFAIVGVLAPEFAGLDEFPRDVWVPLAAYAAVAAPDLVGQHQPRQIEITARLRAGVTAARAQAALTPFMARMPEKTHAAGVRADVRPNATPMTLSLEMLAVLSPVCAAFALVLVAACANVSNVMLSRAITRHREMAVRLSLGASRGRVVRQLLTEGLLVAVLAGAAGLALAASALRVGVAMLFSTLPPSVAALLRVAPIDFDHRVFLFTLAAAAAGTLMFALVPALQASRLTLTDALHGHVSGRLRGSRLRSALVVGQVAVSLVLVIVALTLARNGAAIGAIDLGFHTEGVISVNVRGEEAALVPRLAAALASNPRVAEVAVTGGNPLFIRSRTVAAAPAGGAAVATRYTFVSPEYFSILRIPTVSGRGFRTGEEGAAARVAIVSAATAQKFWPGENPVGKTVRIERPEGRPTDELPGYSEVTIVGAVKDVVSGMMFDGPDTGHIYLPIRPTDPHAVAVLMRPRSERDLGPDALQRTLEAVAPDPQVFEALPLEEMRAAQLYPLQAASWIGSVLAAVALTLSVSGLYGVLTYTLSQRTREIGIRIALGATRGAVVRMVMRQSTRMAGLGAVIGAAVSFGVLKTLSAVITLKTVSLLDVLAFGGGLALVMAATAVAAYHPARRATRVDPAETLRADA